MEAPFESLISLRDPHVVRPGIPSVGQKIKFELCPRPGSSQAGGGGPHRRGVTHRTGAPKFGYLPDGHEGQVETPWVRSATRSLRLLGGRCANTFTTFHDRFTNWNLMFPSEFTRQVYTSHMSDIHDVIGRCAHCGVKALRCKMYCSRANITLMLCAFCFYVHTDTHPTDSP